MKTYLSVWFNSEGELPSKITERLVSLGFKPIKGAFDYEFEWDHTADIEEILKFADNVRDMLAGYKVVFATETV